MSITVPTKRTNEIEMKPVFMNYIKGKYSNEICEKLSSPLSRLDSLRKDIISKMKDRLDSTISLLEEYHDLIFALQNRIPINDSNPMCEFKWYDSFDEGGLFSKNSLKSYDADFERISVLFCIASLCSQIAELKNPMSDEEVKSAVKLYKYSAGIYSHIKYIFPKVYQSDPTTEFKQEVLNLLSLIMLAQGQELILKKCERDKMNPALVTKICNQTFIYYSDALTTYNLKSLKDKLPKPWKLILNNKKIFYEAHTQYYQGKACYEAKSYGEAIVRFEKAYNLLNGKKLVEYDSYLTSYKTNFESVKKENNLIYHEVIPDANSLSSIQTQIIVAPQEIKFPLRGSEFDDPFGDLVPLAAQIALESANNLKNEMISKEINRLKEATQNCNGILSSLNIGSLTLKSNEEIPQNLKDQAKKIREEGGFNSINEIIGSLDSSRIRNIELINNLEKTIDEEDNADQNLKKQFGDRWTRKASSELNATWRNEIIKLRGILEGTSKTDQGLIEKFEKNKEYFRILSNTDNQIIESVRQSSSSQSQGGGSAALKSKIQSLLQDVETMKKDREDLIVQLKETEILSTLRDEFCRQIKQSGFLANQEIAREYINSALEVSRSCINQSIDKQQEILAQLEKCTLEYFGGKKPTEDNASFLSKLILAGESFIDLSNDSKQGLKFYGELSELILKYQQKVDDFIFARNTEKTELMQDITSSAARQAPIAPPPSNTSAPYPTQYYSTMPPLPGMYMGWSNPAYPAYPGNAGPPGYSAQPGNPGQSGYPGQPGNPAYPGYPNYPGYPPFPGNK